MVFCKRSPVLVACRLKAYRSHEENKHVPSQEHKPAPILLPEMLRLCRCGPRYCSDR